MNKYMKHLANTNRMRYANKRLQETHECATSVYLCFGSIVCSPAFWALCPSLYFNSNVMSLVFRYEHKKGLEKTIGR